MGKISKQNHSGTGSREWKPRRARRLPKFRKATKTEIARSLAEYEAILVEMRKLNLPPCDAVQWIREDRTKPWN